MKDEKIIYKRVPARLYDECRIVLSEILKKEGKTTMLKKDLVKVKQINAKIKRIEARISAITEREYKNKSRIREIKIKRLNELLENLKNQLK